LDEIDLLVGWFAFWGFDFQRNEYTDGFSYHVLRDRDGADSNQIRASDAEPKPNKSPFSVLDRPGVIPP
jgi:hypothetical protein